MRKAIEKKRFDEERALYHLQTADVTHCIFGGPRDGESALKEARDVFISDSTFSSRYPLWHAKGFRLQRSAMDDQARAPIWYSRDGTVEGCVIDGVKCLRECTGVRLVDCRIYSTEFGWYCRDLEISKSSAEAEYFLLATQGAVLQEVDLKGKYSFQYTKNLEIRNSILNTKDAFWHSENVTVENSRLNGEYLGWFSKNLTLKNCRISGTQPLCYCENVKLVNCTMEGTDLAFEYSSVEADIKGPILSVKNPQSGLIVADHIGAIFYEDSIMESTARILERKLQYG